MTGSLTPLGAAGLLEPVARATIVLSVALALAWLARKGPAGVRHLLWDHHIRAFARIAGVQPPRPFMGSADSPFRHRPNRAAILRDLSDPGWGGRGRHPAHIRTFVAGRRIQGSPGRGACVTGAFDPASTVLLGSWLRHRTDFADDGRGPVRKTCPHRKPGSRSNPVATGRRDSTAAGDPQRRSVPGERGSQSTDDRWSAEACGPVPRVVGRMVARAVEGRADA